jgi:POT family proton-dependent oligopeptide transporter
MIGYALMAIPDEKWLFIGLSVVIIGNGFFKPNVSSMVGDLYGPHDPRRDGGFTLFYMGINIGALLLPFLRGLLSRPIHGDRDFWPLRWAWSFR